MSRRLSPVALPAVLLAVFVVPLSIAGAATALPNIADHLGSQPIELQWVVNGFNASFAVFTLVWGAISDRAGYKPTFVVGAALNVAASLMCAFAPNLLTLDLGRILGGASAAAIGTSVTSIIAGAYDGPAKARNFALFGTVLGTGLAVGPSVSGGLTAAFGWRGIFVAMAVVVAASLVLSGFVPHIKHDAHPGRRIFDTTLFRNPRFMAVVTVPMIQAFGYIALLTYLPVALSAVYGISAGQTGLFMIAMTGPVLIGPMIGARLVQTHARINLRHVVHASIALMLLGNAGMFLLSAGAPMWTLVVPMILLGSSFGLPLGLLDGAAQDAAPVRSSGAAAGIMNFLRLGSEAVVVGVYAAVMAALIASRVSDHDIAEQIAAGAAGHASVYAHAFVIGQLAIIVAVVAGLLVTLALRRVNNRTEDDPASNETDGVCAAA